MQPQDVDIQQPSRIASSGPDEPLQMSFPSVLRNQHVSDRFAHLHASGGVDGASRLDAPPPLKKRARDEREGKRWIRRRDNALFKGNPHIVPPSERERYLQAPPIRLVFSEPGTRNALVTPSPVRAAPDPTSANAGRFSLSLKGMRRALRQQGWRAEMIVREVEAEMLDWLHEGGTIIMPDIPNSDIPARQIGNEEGPIYEVSRNPLELVWDIEHDNFARYVVHCCARYHNIVSYSKDVSGRRLTYLLRPNVTRQDFTAAAGLATPPATESDRDARHGLDESSEADTASVAGSAESSDSEVDSRLTSLQHRTRHRRLSAVSEQSDNDAAGSDPTLADVSLRGKHGLHVLEESVGVEGDMSDSPGDDELAHSIASLDLGLQPSEDVQLTNASAPVSTSRLGLWDRRRNGSGELKRAPSSPSPSPCPPRRRFRPSGRMKMVRRRANATADSKPTTLAEYLYS